VISPHDILVIESHDNKVFIVLNDGKTVHEATITLKALEALLPPLLFVCCHASYLVHLSSIIAFSAKDLTLTTGEIVPISRARQEQTHAAIASYRLPKRPEYQVAHSA
jgi:DNA-binding LytR/AlgR family response regulator